jgi:hypothetical protein
MKLKETLSNKSRDPKKQKKKHHKTHLLNYKPS